MADIFAQLQKLIDKLETIDFTKLQKDVNTTSAVVQRDMDEIAAAAKQAASGINTLAIVLLIMLIILILILIATLFVAYELSSERRTIAVPLRIGS